MTTLRVAWGWLREAALLTAALVTLCAVLAWVQITGQGWEWGDDDRPETLGESDDERQDQQDAEAW